MSNFEQALEGIAIVGMSGRFPGADNIQDFWNNLIDGKESLTHFSDDELRESGIKQELIDDPNYVKTKGILGNTEFFDAAFFGYTPRVAELMDPQHRIFMECAWEAMEDAGCNAEQYQGRIGVYAGESMNTYWVHNVSGHVDLIASAESLQAAIGNDKDSLTTEVSYKLNLTGPSVTVQSSSSTSLVAVHTACQALLNYECDVALSGGVSIHFPEKAGYLYQEGGTTSKDGKCRAFDADATGFVSGHGAGVVILKRLQDAIEDKDNIYAVIKGSAVNNDGSSKMSYMAPSVKGQREAIAMAHAVADVSPETIEYVEAHGTGTNIGDPIEIAALTEAFRIKTPKKGFCALGSVKTNIGHLDTAAGVVGLIKATLSLHHKLIPPTLNFEKANPQIDFDNSPFFVNTSLRPWVSNNSVRRAGISSFGMGGTNAHLILEEAPKLDLLTDRDVEDYELVTISANTESALKKIAKNLSEDLDKRSELSLTDVAYTLNTGRKELKYRFAFTSINKNEAINELKLLELGQAVASYADKKRPVVFMFTGQGSQYVQMARELFEHEPIFRENFKQCTELLISHIGYDLCDVIYPQAANMQDASRRLRDTAVTQPALFALEYSLAKLLIHWGIQPTAMIGHSIGEYVAATLAGVFTLKDALELVAARGKIIKQLKGGKMLSVHASEEKILPYLNESVSIAAVNTTNACVVAGEAHAIEELNEELSEYGIVCNELQTSHAFHSAMMEPAIEPFSQLVSKVNLTPPSIPIMSNVTGTWLTDEEAVSSSYWANHLRLPVLFERGIGKLLEEPSYIFVEIGPGNTLCSLLNQHTAKKDSHVAVNMVKHPKVKISDCKLIRSSLGKIWINGGDIDWNNYYSGKYHRPAKVSLPKYPFERSRFWLEPVTSLNNQSFKTKSEIERSSVREMLYVPAWKQSTITSFRKDVLNDCASVHYLVFANDDIAEVLEKYFNRVGKSIIIVTPGETYNEIHKYRYTIAPDCKDDYQQLFNNLQTNSIIPTYIIHLWNTGGLKNEVSDSTLFDRTQKMGYYSVIHLIQIMEMFGIDSSKVSIITTSTEALDILGTENLNPELSPLISLARIISQEYPSVQCRHVDLDTMSVNPERIEMTITWLLKELAIQESDSVIAYRNGKRWGLSYEQIIPNNFKDSSLQDGTYLIVGGLGDIGHTLAQYLATNIHAKLILVGRTEIPVCVRGGEGIAGKGYVKAERLHALQEKHGDRIMYVQADATNWQQMNQGIQNAIERFGKINGIIYSVGDIHEEYFEPLHLIDSSSRDIYFGLKVKPLYVLERIINRIKPDFCILNSSIAAILGGIKYAAYAAANQFMDSFVYRQNRIQQDTKWVSVNWDAWKFDNLSEKSDLIRKSDLIKSALNPNEGNEVFHRILSQLLISQVIVSTTNLEVRVKNWNNVSENLNHSTSEPRIYYPRPNLQTDYKPPSNKIEEKLCEIWKELLGIDQIGILDNFFDLGGNSLIGVRLISKVRDEFNVSIRSVSLYEGPTVSSMAQLIKPNKTDNNLLVSSHSRGAKRRKNILKSNLNKSTTIE
ncbi:type I polyketide synthase [Bacillus wiedmannii]|uniref:type I polyketide synthase n=1 Tax=Bacillus wiedmannii TaxID=1890302 RepID=UPI000BEFB409|nr:type I polyketide synthase [Bacillus wiedmannii]PEL52430.1 hypothetical protein CN622_29675 [Bacillus wiedmannii]PEO06293.1 hypothetical protein CN562_29215 [Bacillus wiedmannii]PEQ00754.1 hypothetical protein CN587_27835 [Bacillus wiedmannii]